MIKLSYDVNIYRKQISEKLKSTDYVVELGAHTGNTTSQILKTIINGNIIAIDNSPEAKDPMAKLNQEYSNLKFINGDVRLHNILEEVATQTPRCDILAIDLGGGYHPDTVFKVYYIWSSTLKPKYTFIRNRGLIDFLNTSCSEEKIESSDGWLESCGESGIPPQIKEFRLWSENLKNK
ncbi:MAG: SAM-dependent methyltransferase [Methanobacteriaceae archaeon]